tara:strand:+ start:341 stop:1393 length:1053 start_codon:yes stop_codon:yes gene_type:complete
MVTQSGVCLELTGVSSAKWGFSGSNSDIVSWAWFQNIRNEIFLVAFESDGTASSQQVMGKHSVRETPFVSNQNGSVIATVENGDVFIFETDDGKTFTESKISPAEDLNCWGSILSLTIERTPNRHLMIGIFQKEGHGLESKKIISLLSNEGGEWKIIQMSELDRVSATEDTNFPPILGFHPQLGDKHLMIVRCGFSVQYWDIENNKITFGFSLNEDSKLPTYLKNVKIFTAVNPPSDYCYGIEWGRRNPYYMIIDARTNDVLEKNSSEKPSPTAMKVLWKHLTSGTTVYSSDNNSASARDVSDLSKILAEIEGENQHSFLSHNRLWTFVPSSIPKPPKVVTQWELVSMRY